MKPSPKQKLKQHFYSVSVKTDARQKKKDNTPITRKKAAEVKSLAASKGFDDVSVKMDDEMLARLGIFFMQAPESFAQEVKKIDGISAVEKPAEKSKRPNRGKRR